MVFSRLLFKSNLPPVGKFSFRYMPYVLFGKTIEWDLVNSGGMNNTIMNIPCCFVLFIISFLSKNNRILSVSCVVSTVLLLFSCCFSSRFLGWYLLPLVFLLSLLTANSKFAVPVLILNFLLVLHPLLYQITSKVDQIQNIKNSDILNLHIKNWKSSYDDSYKHYSFVEISDSLDFDCSYDYKDGESSGEKQLLFISNRALSNNHIKNLLYQSKTNLNGYSLVDYKDGIWFCKFEKN